MRDTLADLGRVVEVQRGDLPEHEFIERVKAASNGRFVLELLP